MIAIVILGLGLVMVATMFPVAWGRARTLSEFTVQRTITGNAHATASSLVRVSGLSYNASSFEGDLLFKPDLVNPTILADPPVPIAACPDNFPSDTWVHALNLDNIQINGPQFVSEDLWRTQDPLLKLHRVGDPVEGDLPEYDVVKQSYFRKRISFHERVYPPIVPRDKDTVDVNGEFIGDDERWDNALDTRRFCWAVFHRLRTELPYDPERPFDALGTVRSFDMYYVTLRRPQSSFRYARQDPSPNFVPNPCELKGMPVTPKAMDPDSDVMFPVPWRVQVQFPGTLELKVNATGIPTEIEVPPPNSPANDLTKTMLVQMFPRGAHFIDEITGLVFRVVKRRVTGANADQAFLTLDREVFLEDIDLPNRPDGSKDPRCEFCTEGTPDPQELLRTVWVFPPPVQASRGTNNSLIFAGSQPVVAIDIQTLNVAPTR